MIIFNIFKGIFILFRIFHKLFKLFRLAENSANFGSMVWQLSGLWVCVLALFMHEVPLFTSEMCGTKVCAYSTAGWLWLFSSFFLKFWSKSFIVTRLSFFDWAQAHYSLEARGVSNFASGWWIFRCGFQVDVEFHMVGSEFLVVDDMFHVVDWKKHMVDSFSSMVDGIFSMVDDEFCKQKQMMICLHRSLRIVDVVVCNNLWKVCFHEGNLGFYGCLM